jgi:hypothetical protein
MNRLAMVLVVTSVFLDSCGVQERKVGEMQHEPRSIQPEKRDRKIVRQVDTVTRASRVGGEKEIGRRLPTRRDYPRTCLEANVPLPNRLPRFEQATEKEDLK